MEEETIRELELTFGVKVFLTVDDITSLLTPVRLKGSLIFRRAWDCQCY